MTKREHESEAPEMAELPDSWKTLPSGSPAPNWVAALDEARDRDFAEVAGTMEPMAHATKMDKTAVERQAAIERTRGMFAHLAPGESLADELIADRRTEARAEDLQEAKRPRRRGAG